MDIAAKRKGRASSRGDEPATRMLTMRLRPSDYEILRAEAEANGRSISAQAETRMFHPSQPVMHEAGRMVSLVVEELETRLGKPWNADDNTKMRVRSAVDSLMQLLLGDKINFKAVAERYHISEYDSSRDERIRDMIVETYPFLDDAERVQLLVDELGERE